MVTIKSSNAKKAEDKNTAAKFLKKKIISNYTMLKTQRLEGEHCVGAGRIPERWFSHDAAQIAEKKVGLQ